jgi:hypothetical protein
MGLFDGGHKESRHGKRHGEYGVTELYEREILINGSKHFLNFDSLEV